MHLTDVYPTLYPKIETEFDADCADPMRHHYRASLSLTLHHLLPEIFSHKPLSLGSQIAGMSLLKSKLPFITHSEFKTPPYNLSFYAISKYRANAFKFFFEMISRWLVPGHRLNVVLFNAVDFSIPEFGEEIYTLEEILIRVETEKEQDSLTNHLPLLIKEIKLGLALSYYARRILEVKGLSMDEKTAVIQENINYLIRRLPGYFEDDIFSEMQHLLVICKDEFKRQRSCRLLSRIISTQYLFRKQLIEAVASLPLKRHLFLKLFRTHLMHYGENKRGIGIVLGVNYLSDNEVLEDRHIIKALQNYIPYIKSVEGSYFINKRSPEKLCTLYLEVEKIDGSEFSGEEIQLLKMHLPNDLKDRIEQLVHPVFMQRNEEEIFRNIVALSQQINSSKDIPQAFISYEEQRGGCLYFVLILVRPKALHDPSLLELFKNSTTFFEYIQESCKIVGYTARQHPKEATVFSVKLKNHFLRDDHSIDVNKARQVVHDELFRIIGPFRDYNGGMISKQNELFRLFREALDEEREFHEFIIENFFYSMTPAVMRSVLDPLSLKRLFLLMVEALEERRDIKNTLNIVRELDRVMVMITAENERVKERLMHKMNQLNIPSSRLAMVHLTVRDVPCLGFIYLSDDPYSQEHFCQLLQHDVGKF